MASTTPVPIEIVGQRTRLEKNNGTVVQHSWTTTGRIGMWERDPGADYTYETFARFDLSGITGTIEAVQLQITCNEAGSSPAQATADLWVQANADHTVWDNPGRAPKFDDFTCSRWDRFYTPINSVAVSGIGTYTFADSNTSDLKTLVESWLSGAKDPQNGVVITVNFGAVDSWLSVDEARLVVTTSGGGQPGEDYTVSGKLTDSNGVAFAPATVTAYDKGIGSEKELGRADIPGKSTDGAYSIIYHRADLIDPRKTNADLIVRATSVDGNLLAASDLIAGAPQHAKVNLYIPVDTAPVIELEYVEVGRIIDPLVDDPNVSLPDLTSQDVAVIARKTGITKSIVEAYIKARQIGDAATIAVDFLYGLFRQGLPQDTRRLAAYNDTDLFSALEAAASKYVIARTYADKNVFNVQLEALRVNALNRVFERGTRDADLLKALLTLAGYPNEAEHKNVLRAQLSRGNQDATYFWNEVRTLLGIEPDDVTRIQTAFELSDLTGHHTPLTTVLFNRQEVNVPRDVARLADVDLQQAVSDAGSVTYFILGETQQERDENYLKFLKQRIEARYPSMLLATRLPANTGEGETDEFVNFRAFIEDNPNFNISRTNLDDYIKATGGILEADLRQIILRLQTMYNAIPGWAPSEHLYNLWSAGFKSPHNVSRKGKSGFRKAVASLPNMTIQLSEGIYNSCACAVSKTLAVSGAIGFGPDRLAIFEPGNEAMAAATPLLLESTPTLESLFGTQDSYQVSHCASVFGPSAYLVDCLEYLKRTQTVPESSDSGLDELKKRRPDISGINLSCINTMTVMPYIDLVNEIFEHMSVDGEEIPHAIPDPLEPDGYRNETLQTILTAEELAVHPDPENTFHDAYANLRNQIYPWNFDLYREEAAAYLAKGGVPRYQLMEILSAYPDDPTLTLNRACEVLGITQNPGPLNELTALAPTTIDPAPSITAEQVYGDGATFDNLKNLIDLVPCSLLSYEQLVEILEVNFASTDKNFVNPKHTLIVFGDGDGGGTCALEHATIDLTPEELINLYRFRILLRKTGWSVETLDTLLVYFDDEYVAPVTDPEPDPGVPHAISARCIEKLALVKRLEMERSIKPEYIVAAIGNYDKGISLVTKAVKLSQDEIESWAAILSYDPSDPLGTTAETDLDTFVTRVLAFSDVQLDAAQVSYLTGSLADYSEIPTDEDLVAFFKDLRDRIEEAQGNVYQRELLAKELYDFKIQTADDGWADYLGYNHDLLSEKQAALAIEEAKVPPERDEAFILLLQEAIAALTALIDILDTVLDPDPYLSTWLAGKLDEIRLKQHELAVELSKPEPDPVLVEALELDILALQDALSGDLEKVEPLMDSWLEDLLDKKQAQLAEKQARLAEAQEELEEEEAKDPEDQDEELIASLTAEIAALSSQIPAIQSGIAILAGKAASFKLSIDTLTTQKADLTDEVVLTQLFTSVFTDADIPEKEEIISRAVDIVTAQTDLPPEDPPELTAADIEFVQTYFKYFTDPEQASAFLVGTIDDDVFHMTEESLEARFEYVRLEIFRNNVIQQYSAKYRIDADVARELIYYHYTVEVDDATKSAIDFFTEKDDADPNSINGDVFLALDNETVFEAVKEQLSQKIFPFSIIASAYDIDLPYLHYMLTHVLLQSTYSLDQLKKLGTISELRKVVSENDGDVFTLLDLNPVDSDPVARVAAHNTIALGLGTDQNTITFLVKYLWWPDEELDPVTPSNEWLHQLQRAVQTLNQLKITITTEDDPYVFNWAAITVAKESADQIKESIKALYADDWNEVGVEIRNPIRGAQRDILEATIIASGVTIGDEDVTFTDRNELYEYFLVDPGMEPCTMTSRMVLATSSVQLFIQRALLGFEPTVKIDSEVAKEWDWRKNYRLWEANRKVFLYPENWIEPELRDDKTPFFKELEDELLQGEVNDTNVEKAYLSYLFKLRDASNLDIVGLYKEYYSEDQIKDDEKNWSFFGYTQINDHVLHVFGRTHGIPHKYYYRKFEVGVWTPWEAMDIEIDADQIMPIVHNRRLHLIWPSFMERAQDLSVKANQPYFEIKLQYSTYDEGRWTPPKISSDFFATNAFNSFVDNKIFKPEVDDYMAAIIDKYGDLYSAFYFLIDLPVIPELKDIVNSLVDKFNSKLDEIKGKFDKEVVKTSAKDEIIDLANKAISDLTEEVNNFEFPATLLPPLVFPHPVGSQLDDLSETARVNIADIAESLEAYADSQGFNLEQLADKQKYLFKTIKDEGKNSLITYVGFASNGLVDAIYGGTTGNVIVSEINEALGAAEGALATATLIGTFEFNSCTGCMKLGAKDSGVSYLPLYYTRPSFSVLNSGKHVQAIEKHTYTEEIVLDITGKKGNANYLDINNYVSSLTNEDNYKLYKLMSKPPETWEIATPQQDLFFLGESPFVFQSGPKSFIVFPEDPPGPGTGFSVIDLSDGQAMHQRASTLQATAINKKITIPVLANSLNTKGMSVSVYPALKSAISTGRAYASKYPGLFFSAKGTSASSASIASLGIAVAKCLSGTLTDPHFSDSRVVLPGMTYQPALSTGKTFNFHTFFHPYTCLFIQQVNRYGLEGILSPGQGPETDQEDKYLIRQGADDTTFFGQNILTEYSPNPVCVSALKATADIDFGLTEPYSIYNWEVFFHAPLMIATRLMQNGKYEDAMKWFHFIFDPTADDKDRPQVYWQTKPFYQHAQIIGDPIIQFVDSEDDIETLLKEWWANPFNPHLIARFRKIAYMKNVVMKYLDNLIAWGDMLFRSDTTESINEATQLYVLAAQILGRKPILVERESGWETSCYDEMVSGLELIAPVDSTLADLVSELDDQITILHSLLYFGGVPRNDNLLGYWDTVGDRLFKIHNCMNIDGVVRVLDLFAPPIDPALLVKAAAAGLDFSAVLNDLAAPAPTYRYRVLQQRAVDLCGDVKTLGAALLSALEKNDAEELSKLRATHEVSVVEATLELKELTVDEAKENVDGLEAAKAVIEARKSHYSELIDTGLIPEEEDYEDKLKTAAETNLSASSMDFYAAALNMIPSFSIGISGLGGHNTVSFGGSNLGAGISALAAGKRAQGTWDGYEANQAAITATNARREEDWEFQLDLAEKELPQVESQIIAAEIRLALAEKDQENTKLQIDNAKEAYAFFKDKYTNQELYSWMIGQISGVYYQAYQLAYDMARKAERAYKAEIFDDDTNYIKFDNWDSLHKGLLAGEKLHNDLKRLEAAFINKNKRQLEITKNVSLSTVNPGALIDLRKDGVCTFTIPEVVYDIDYPGQYQRRIKSISLSIPCVAGPNTNVGAKLSMTKDTIRMKPTLVEADGVLLEKWGGIQTVATSQGLNDSGMFELNFTDDRYFPFEGAGAISEWRLELPKVLKPFDYNTISDVLVTVRYTAKEDGLFRTAVESGLISMASESFGMLVSLKELFPAELEQLLTEPIASASPITLDVSELPPGFLKGTGVTAAISEIDSYKLFENVLSNTGDEVVVSFAPDSLNILVHNNGTALTNYNDIIVVVRLSVS